MATVLITASAALPHPAPVQGYLFEHWQLEDGLPQITSLALAQDAQGYLWIGTEQGVARFDGLRFVVFDRTTTPGLRHNVVQALLVARDGTLWIGTRDGLHRHTGGDITPLTHEDGLADNVIRSLCEDRQGRLWVGSETGLSRLADGTFRAWTPADGLPAGRVRALAEDGEGVMWVGTDGGLVRVVEEGGEARFEAAPGFPAGVRVEALLASGWQQLWAGTDAGLWQLRDGRVVGSIRDELDDPSVFALFQEAGGLWIGTGAGLSRLGADGDLESFQKGEVRALLGDREGGLWIGTRFDGLLRARRRRIGSLGTWQGLPEPLTWVVLEDRQGTLWVGGRGGLTHFAVAGAVTYTTRDGLPENSVRSIYEDRRGTFWLGTQSRGGAMLREGRIQAFPLSGKLVEPRVTRFLEDPEGGLWVATGEGLFRRGDEGWRPFSQNGELPSLAVYDILFDPHGVLWIATDNGLASWRDGVVTTYQEGFGALYLLSLHEAEDGTLWIGTWGGGLSRLRDGEVRSVAIHPSLSEIHRILDDGQRSFWMSSNRGIFRVDKAALAGLFEEAPPQDALRLAWFDETDGMPSRECNGGSHPAGWRGRDGTLYFPTIRGVAVVDPRRLGKDPPIPMPVIEQVRADQQALDPRSEPVLPPGTRVLDFHFAAPGFTAPHKVRYRVRLDGFDQEWIDADERRSATYTNLLPGEYRFRVRAGTEAGAWGDREDVFAFRIPPAFYQTRWFWAASTLLLTFLAWGAYRYRVYQLLRASQLRMLEAKSAEMEHFLDTVAHDLKSPLFTVRGFLGHLENDLKSGAAERVDSDLRQIRAATEKMSHMVEELLELSRLGRVESRPEESAASELVSEALDAVAGRIVERGVEVDVAPDLPTLYGDRSRLVQVLQNLIENAVKYMGTQESPRIEIRGRSAGGEDVLSVRDNGMGIDPDRLDEVFDLFTKLDAASDGSGVGLALVHRVVELHGGRVWAESEGEGRGTTFFVALPRKSV